MKPVLRDGVIMNAAVLNAAEVVNQRLMCPACCVFEFQMWPEGWDGHAGFRCEGLENGSPEERKEEFIEV